MKPEPRRKKGSGKARKAVSRRVALALPASYAELLDQLKARVRTAQVKAAVAANRELIELYWDIGQMIVERQQREGWGQSVIERLSADLQKAFPGLKGFSPSNMSRMRAFYFAYTSSPGSPRSDATESKARNSAQVVPKTKRAISAQAVPKLPATDLPPAVAAIPWGHNVILLFKLSDYDQRLWYAEQTVAHGWSRAVLTVQIESHLYRRQGKAVTNFANTLPSPQSDLAQQAIKDPYVFDFLTIADDARERELETGLLAHIEKFLVELGVGFAFVGRQVPVQVGDEDFHIDLLFYHLKLRAFVVIDLKMEQFQAEFAGKMNFYLSAVDDQMRHLDDQPSIGLILCKRRDRIIAEYALRDMSKPIGVSEWQTKLVQSLPARLRGSLPTIKQIEAELAPKPKAKSKKK